MKLILNLKQLIKPNLVGLGIFFFLNIVIGKQEVYASQIVLTCNAGRYYAQVHYDSSSKDYTYIAYDKNISRDKPSLVLRNGKIQSGHTAYYYTFKTRNYSYILSKRFEGRGGEAFLNVYKSEKQIFHQQCQ